MDSGCQSLITIARLNQVPAEYQQLRHQFADADTPLNDNDLLRAAKAIGFKARQINSTAQELNPSILPAIAKGHDGQYFIIAKVGEPPKQPKAIDKEAPHEPEQKKAQVLMLYPNEEAPTQIDLDELPERWNGELILLTKRGGLLASFKEFDIRWFIPAMVKYRKLFGDVLIASFFIQLFALVTPLFFQVIMDKVLVHKGLTTLEVLAFGFFVIALFNAILSGIRTYIFSHTTNRVDVELGSKLYNHLMGLPLPYFEARQVGQSVARVRELDTIRNFITGSALTLCIDLLFTFVFFAVMWYYSPKLTLLVMATIPLYIILSVVVTPMLRARLDEKFKHGAENQAFLTESITGVETVKACAVEPQMQRKWEDQLAKYVNASFSTQQIGNISNQIAGFISKMTTLGQNDHLRYYLFWCLCCHGGRAYCRYVNRFQYVGRPSKWTYLKTSTALARFSTSRYFG